MHPIRLRFRACATPFLDEDVLTSRRAFAKVFCIATQAQAKPWLPSLADVSAPARGSEMRRSMGLLYRHSRSITLWLASLLYVTWALVFIWHSSILAEDKHRYFSLFDDAMISMRYAWNLAHGKGCTWNPGEYVQGFTTPLMVGLMALPCAVLSKSAACLAVQLFGIPTVLGVAWFTRRLCQFVSDNRWLPVISFVAILAYYPLSYWSLMGMETGVVCLCMLVAIYYALRRESWQSNIAMCLAFFARPDFLVVAALLLVFLFLANKRKALVGAGILSAVVVVVFASQHLYYGDPFPNPYSLKIDGYPLLGRIERGAGFIAPFLSGAVPLLAFAMASVSAKASRARYQLLLICCAVIAYQIYAGGDPWPYWRMLTPMMPAALALAVVGAQSVMRGHTVATGAAILASMVLCDVQFLPQMALSEAPYKTDENARNLNEAILLNRVLRPGSSIGVEYAGVLPYYTDFRAIDFLGKNDRHIASLTPSVLGHGRWSETQVFLPGHNKYDLDYSIGVLKPDYIQIYRYGHSDTSPWIQQLYELRVVDGHEIIVRKGSVP